MIFNKKIESFINENYDTISTNKYNVIDFKEKLRLKKLLFAFKNNKIVCKCNDNLNEKLTEKIKTDLQLWYLTDKGISVQQELVEIMENIKYNRL